MVGVWSGGSSLDVESAAALCGHCVRGPAAGGHLQQEVSGTISLISILNKYEVPTFELQSLTFQFGCTSVFKG